MTGSKNAPDRDPERLVRAYADLVLRVCYTYLRSTVDAEDVCQDTLVKLLLHDEPFRDCVSSSSFEQNVHRLLSRLRTGRAQPF